MLVSLPVLFTKKNLHRLHEFHLPLSEILVYLQKVRLQKVERVCLPTPVEPIYLQRVHLRVYSCCLFTNQFIYVKLVYHRKS